MSARLLRSGAVIAWSVLVWCALWSDLSLANVVWGVVVGAVSLWVLPVAGDASGVGVRPVWAAAYLVNGLWALVKSSGVVAWEVVTPRNRINQAIVAVPLRTRSLGIATLVANTVTLTPGTMTLEIRREPPALYIHIMHLRTIEAVRDDIHRLEDLALRAFPAVDAEAEPITEST